MQHFCFCLKNFIFYIKSLIQSLIIYGVCYRTNVFQMAGQNTQYHLLSDPFFSFLFYTKFLYGFCCQYWDFMFYSFELSLWLELQWFQNMFLCSPELFSPTVSFSMNFSVECCLFFYYDENYNKLDPCSIQSMQELIEYHNQSKSCLPKPCCGYPSSKHSLIAMNTWKQSPHTTLFMS